jgi:hypothetical protein
VTVWLKIKEFLNLSCDLCEDCVPNNIHHYKLHCSCMSMIHLMNAIDANNPNCWGEHYFAMDGANVGDVGGTCKVL